MSFMRFLNLSISDDVPDSKTIWNSCTERSRSIREQLTDLDLVDDLFCLFLRELERLNLIVN
jgi:hypothetical protein